MAEQDNIKMNNDVNTPSNAFQNDEAAYNKPIIAIPKPEQNVGIDLTDALYQNIINAGTASAMDMSKIDAFTSIAKTRDQLYTLLDTMGDDSAISAVLETYAEDATEPSETGKIIWATSNTADVASYVNYLLDSMNVDKNIYKWVYALCKYGDVYLRLYRESDYRDLIFEAPEEQNEKIKLYEELLKEDNQNSNPKSLKEDINIKAYNKNDKYVPYLEMVDNPAEMFELTRFGKTAGYIQADIPTNALTKTNPTQWDYFKYQVKRNDVNIYQPTEFVHASLEDNTSRIPEEVEIFVDRDANLDNNKAIKMTYKVRRGQSLLYTAFKVWRQLMLLENSVMLNRLTKSSIVRLINVEVGDMAKESVGPHLQGVKGLMEQKSAISVGESLSEYTNPGPMENNVYLATRNGVGAVSMTSVGGDVDVKGLADLEYYRDKMYGTLKVPKQFLGFTDDNGGFSGGQSLSIISSRYAKTTKRIQNTIIQAITDAVNLMLINRGLNNYVNAFELKMQPPTTREEIDRRDNASSKIQIIRDVMDIAADVTDPIIRLKMLKSMLANTISDTEVITLIEEMIDKAEMELNSAGNKEDDEPTTDDSEFNPSEPLNFNPEEKEEAQSALPTMADVSISEEESDENEDDKLPSPGELADKDNLGDFSDMTNPNFK